MFPAPICTLLSSSFFPFPDFVLSPPFFLFPDYLAFVDSSLELESLSELESSESLIFFLAGFLVSVALLGTESIVVLTDFPFGFGESSDESELDEAFLIFYGELEDDELLELICYFN